MHVGGVGYKELRVYKNIYICVYIYSVLYTSLTYSGNRSLAFFYFFKSYDCTLHLIQDHNKDSLRRK